MKHLAIASALMLAGCEGSVGVDMVSRNAAPSSNGYSVVPVATAGDYRLIRIHNKATGKVHLVARHTGYESESMVKLEEWTEEGLGESETLLPHSPKDAPK